MAHSRWTRSRVFRLGMLIARGLRDHEVARDPVIDASVGEVREMARRYGAGFPDTRMRSFVVEVENDIACRLIEGAQSARTHSEKLAARMIGRAVADPILFANALEE